MITKIAITSAGKGLNSRVDSHFGRCPYFVIVELKNGSILVEKSVENTGKNQRSGAGIKAAQIIGNEKAEAVITGNIGPKALNALKQLGIKVYVGQGNIKRVTEQFLQGKLKPVQ